MQQGRIGRYQILEEIAYGGQGSVYRASSDPEGRRIVALKVLHASLTRDRSYVERFQREAHLAASIDHPKVTRIFEVGEDEGRYFISMEFLPESLARVIEASGAMRIDGAAEFAIQVAEGLAAAHALGIVHRDVKPQNVLITADGTAKVTDFGIARAEALSTMTATGAMMGTPLYMSPEQAQGERADARSDVYSLGCMLYQMLTGELPFTGNTPLVVLRQHVEKRPRPVRELRPNLPRRMASVVERAMAKAPERRFESAAELAHELTLALDEAVPEAQRSRTQLEPLPISMEAPPKEVPEKLRTPEAAFDYLDECMGQSVGADAPTPLGMGGNSPLIGHGSGRRRGSRRDWGLGVSSVEPSGASRAVCLHPSVPGQAGPARIARGTGHHNNRLGLGPDHHRACISATYGRGDNRDPTAALRVRFHRQGL